ncbi:CoA ester lyase [Pseudomonas aeruginosa]|uniref:HpcH/HpaI aldolase/citrate lyase family protein n=1 Tax=Pseudomonas aeruginosa TaxID=287 RepID=UPI0031B73870
MPLNARSALFVPGDRPERFAKALTCGADYVIIDLEDAVDESHKTRARQNILEFSREYPQYKMLVRINAPGHPLHDDDLALCRDSPSVVGIVLPKAETTEQIAHAAQSRKALWPIIESARGVAAIASLAQATGIKRMCLGTVDLSLDLGLEDGAAADLILDQARYALLVHSRTNSLSAPLDGVFLALDDSTGLAAAAQRAKAMGLAGMLCLHPKQVPVIHKAWQPGAEAVAWARKVVEAAEQCGVGAFRLDGQMIDAPVLARAQKLIALAGHGPA